MTKKALVRNGRHMRPMLSVLERYGIGDRDQYDRGLWIKETDLEAIKNKMVSDKTLLTRWYPETIMVQGTCIHNQVRYEEFEELFK